MGKECIDESSVMVSNVLFPERVLLPFSKLNLYLGRFLDLATFLNKKMGKMKTINKHSYYISLLGLP